MRGRRRQIGHLPLAHAADNYEMLQHENGNGSQMKCLKIYGYFKLKRKRVFNALLSQTRTHTHTQRRSGSHTDTANIFYSSPLSPENPRKEIPPTKVARITRQIFFPSCCCFIFCSLVSNQFQCLHAQQQREQQAGNNNNNKYKQPIRWLKSLKI